MKQREVGQPGNPSDLSDRTAARTQLLGVLLLVQERRREWDALCEGGGIRKGRSGQRLEKLMALRSFPPAWTLTILMEALRGAWPARAEALDQLARGFRDRRTRALLYSILWRNDDELSLPAARAVLDHASQDPELLLRAVGVLRHARDSEAVPALLPHLQSDNEQLRLATIAAIKDAAPPAILTPALLPLRNDPCPAVARAALQALNGGERVDLFRSLPRNFSLPSGIETGAAPDLADLPEPFEKRVLAVSLLLHFIIAVPWVLICVVSLVATQHPGFLLAITIPIWGLWAARFALVGQQKRTGRTLAPILTAVSELDAGANHDELQKLLRPLDRMARDVMRETRETRKACREAAERIRLLTAETRDLPRVIPDAIPGHDLPRTLQDERPAGKNCMEEEMPAEAPRGSPADHRPRPA